VGSLVPVHPVAVTIGFHVIRESYVCSLAWHGTDAEASIFREPSAFARIMTRSNSAKEPKSVGFGACDSPLEGDGFELVVRRCVVGSRLADDIAEAPRPADLGGLRRWASAGMTKARCRVILGALPT